MRRTRRTAKQMAEIRLAEYKRQQFYHKVRWTIFWILASPIILVILYCLFSWACGLPLVPTLLVVIIILLMVKAK